MNLLAVWHILFNLFFIIISFSDCASAPKLSPIPNNKTQTEASLFQIFCSVQEGLTPLTFQWYRTGQLLANHVHDSGYKIEIFERYSIFSIANITRNDAANYSCVAKNSMGTDSLNSELIVKVAPRWLIEPNDTRINAGRQLSLECKADGLPKPVVKWISSKGNIIYSENLILNKISIKTHEKYECVADNGMGDVLRKVVNIYFSGKSNRSDLTARVLRIEWQTKCGALYVSVKKQ